LHDPRARRGRPDALRERRPENGAGTNSGTPA